MRLKSWIALAFLLTLVAYASTSASAATCTFEVLVKTGFRKNAGTDSRISLQVRGKTGPTLSIPSLKTWGGQAGRNYFESGNLDRFIGTGPCLTSSTPCRMVITSSGTGNKPGWYLSYVQVTPVQKSPLLTWRWDVEQWLTPPSRLTAIRDDCSYP